MSRNELSQQEADYLFSLPKKKVDDTEWDFPSLGGVIAIPLISFDGRENFILDIHRSYIAVAKYTYQNRGRKDVILARLDIQGPPHRNPDDTEIPTPHLHVYRQGYAAKWAYPVPMDSFSNLQDSWITLMEFMAFCNIQDTPQFVRDLFI